MNALVNEYVTDTLLYQIFLYKLIILIWLHMWQQNQQIFLYYFTSSSHVWNLNNDCILISKLNFLCTSFKYHIYIASKYSIKNYGEIYLPMVV